MVEHPATSTVLLEESFGVVSKQRDAGMVAGLGPCESCQPTGPLQLPRHHLSLQLQLQDHKPLFVHPRALETLRAHLDWDGESAAGSAQPQDTSNLSGCSPLQRQMGILGLSEVIYRGRLSSLAASRTLTVRKDFPGGTLAPTRLCSH